MVQIRATADTDKIRARKRAMLHAASRAFRAKGFHDASMRDIAAALGMTVGNLYYYFESKRHLLAFCQDDTLTRLLDSVSHAARVKRHGLTADQRLWLLIVGHVVCLNESVPGSLAHLEVEQLPSRARRPMLDRRDRYERRLRAVVSEGIAERRFRKVDPKVAVLAILGGLNWTVRWFRPDGRLSARDLGEQIAEQFVRGLLMDGVEFEKPDVDLPRANGLIETENGE